MTVPLLATLAVCATLAAGAVARLAGAGSDGTWVSFYEASVAFGALAVAVDLAHGRWEEVVTTNLVVDLGDDPDGELRQIFADALGDPTLELGIWIAARQGYATEAGRPLTVPPAHDPDRASTMLEHDGEPMALVVHDAGVPGDLLRSDAAIAALQVAAANARMRADIEKQIVELDASRRRLVESADHQRVALLRSLERGPQERLTRVAALIAGIEQEMEAELAAARADLTDLAQGIHPRLLLEHGLRPALEQLAARTPLPVDVDGGADRLPVAVEAGLYFASAEALANATKHARARAIHLVLSADMQAVRLVVRDDGVGGADPSGFGLRSLADRIIALGGRSTVTSPSGGGTTVEVIVPR